MHHSKIARPMLPMGRVQSIDHGSALKVRSRRVSPVPVRSGEGPLIEPGAGAQPRRREPLNLPFCVIAQGWAERFEQRKAAIHSWGLRLSIR